MGQRKGKSVEKFPALLLVVCFSSYDQHHVPAVKPLPSKASTQKKKFPGKMQRGKKMALYFIYIHLYFKGLSAGSRFQ